MFPFPYLNIVHSIPTPTTHPSTFLHLPIRSSAPPKMYTLLTLVVSSPCVYTVVPNTNTAQHSSDYYMAHALGFLSRLCNQQLRLIYVVC